MNQFYLSDFSNKTPTNSCKLHKLFKIDSNLNLNQFCFDEKLWLNGLNLLDKSENKFLFAFYALNKSTTFILNWK
jgi:hypothetical protein